MHRSKAAAKYPIPNPKTLARLWEERGSGEIGRRTGFRFQRSKGRVGSSPTFRTNSKKTRKLAGLFLFPLGLQAFLQQDHTEPAVEFVSHPWQVTHLFEAELFMHLY